MQKIFTASVLIVFLLSGLQASEDPRVKKVLGEASAAPSNAHAQLKQDIQGAMESGIDTLNGFLNPDDSTVRSHINNRLRLDIRNHADGDNVLEAVAANTDNDEAKQLLDNKLKELKE